MNRRSALGVTATTGIALALSRARAFAQAVGPGPEMSALSTYMSAAGARALPAEAAEHAKHHLLDTLASMISGSELPPGQAALRYIRAHGGKGETTIAGSALRRPTLRSPTASWRMRMRPTTRTTLPAHIRDARWYPRRSPPAKNSASRARASFAP